jgi:hypothetical protein
MLSLFLLLLVQLGVADQSDCPGIQVSSTTLSAAPDSIFFSSVDVLVTKLRDGSVIRSTDGGKTFDVPIFAPGQVETLYMGYDTRYFYGILSNKSIAVSSNSGASFSMASSHVGGTPQSIEVHRDMPHRFIVTALSDTECATGNRYCARASYLTYDAGAHLYMLDQFTLQTAFGIDKRVFVLSANSIEGYENFSAPTLFAIDDADGIPPYSRKTLLTRCGGAVMTDTILFATQYASATDSNHAQLFVAGSRGNIELGPVEIDGTSDLPAAYTIVSMEEDGVIVLNVAESNRRTSLGSLYISDFVDPLTGSGTSFSKSLERNYRTPFHFVAFAQLKGIRGVYFAGVVPEGHARADQVETMVSFDRGGEWVKLPIAIYPALPMNVAVNASAYRSQGIGPIVSRDNAVGMIIASGRETEEPLPFRIGDDPLDTFLSVDAGASWTKILEGSAVYDFADRGSLLVLAPTSTDTTSTFSYTWNMGHTMNECALPEPLKVYNVLADGDSLAQSVIIYGTTAGGTWKMVQVDFRDLHETTCLATDYETFIPVDKEDGGCLLGTVTGYERRKADRACYNSREYEPVTVVRKCECTLADYECDSCFVALSYEGQDEASLGECVPDVDVESCRTMLEERSHFCENHPHVPSFILSQGYKKIPGDQCEGGVDRNPTTYFCSATPAPPGSPTIPPVSPPPSTPPPPGSEAMCGSDSHSSGVTTTVTPVDGDVSELYYFGSGIFVVTQTGTVYRTMAGDKGAFVAIEPSVFLKPSPRSGVVAASPKVETMLESPLDDKTIYALGPWPSRPAWKSTDGGRTFELLDGVGTPGAGDGAIAIVQIILHPTKKDVALFVEQIGKVLRDVTFRLLLTTDAGVTFSQVDDKVATPRMYQENMGFFDDDTMIWLTASGDVKQQKLSGSSVHVMLSSVKDLARQTFSGLVVKDEAHATPTWFALTGSSELHVAPQGGSFLRATFSPSLSGLKTNGFAILESFIVASYPGGHLFVAEEGGQPEFTQSLEGLVEVSGSKLHAFVDFATVPSYSGVFMANQKTNGTDSHVTYMSFDAGARWDRVRAPPNDVYGNSLCDQECFLNFVSLTDYQLRDGFFYSVDNAVGVALVNAQVQTKNVGFDATYAGDVDFFVTSDGGTSFDHVGAGLHVAEIGNFGGILLATEGGAGKYTTTVKYSWDLGLSWDACQFDDQELHVTNIRIDDRVSSSEFLLHGKPRHGRGGEVLVYLNFTGIHVRDCDDDDLVTWSSACVNGAHEVYKRRKRRSRCRLASDFAYAVSTEACACTWDDYECDVCHERLEGAKECVKVPDCTVDAPVCSKDGERQVSKGYRPVPENKCDVTVAGSVNLLPTTEKCTPGEPVGPTPTNGKRHKKQTGGGVGGVVAVIFILLALVAGLFAANRYLVQNRGQTLVAFVSAKLKRRTGGGYNRFDAPGDMDDSLLDDDDGFGL